MFEKDAEEYVKVFTDRSHIWSNDKLMQLQLREAYKDGAEFGYNKANLKLRNCMNCKHRDVGGYTTCEVIGVVLCNHWEMKE